MKVFLKLSSRTGNPEVWAYGETPTHCQIVFGSMVTGGIQSQIKPCGYGWEKEAKKRLKYSEVSVAIGVSPYTESDIVSAKALYKWCLSSADQPDLSGVSKGAIAIMRSACNEARIMVPNWARLANAGATSTDISPPVAPVAKKIKRVEMPKIEPGTSQVSYGW